MSIPTEYLLNNIIDEDFQAVLFPLKLLQSIHLIFNYTVINNFITPERNISFFFKSVTGSTVLLLTYIIRHIFYSQYLYAFSNSVLTFLLYFYLIHFSLVSIMIYIDSALERNNVVELVIRLQKVINSIKLDKKAFYLKHKVENWVSTLSLFGIFMFIWLFSIQELEFFRFLIHFPFTACLLIFDINIVNATRTVVMIKNLLVAWTHAMQANKKNDIKADEEISDNDLSEKAMFESYCEIIQSFRLCNKVYAFSFAYYAFQTFIYILFDLQSVIELGKSSAEGSFFQSWVMRIVSALYNIKNVTLLAKLSIACQNFYTTVKLAESSCAQILNGDGTAGMRKTCKNVLRLNGAVMQKLSAFGVFELDAALPLQLLSGLVSYTVVLLQFAFL